jgi:hypothetical protein
MSSSHPTTFDHDPFDFSSNDSIAFHSGLDRSIFLAKYHESFVGVEEPLDHQPFAVYPNPSSDFVIIEFAVQSHGEATLFDLTGHQVRSYVVKGQRQQLSVSGIASGVYLLQYSSGDEAHVQQVVIR